MTVEVLVGSKALELLSDNLFLEKWDSLYHTCPWATIYQSKEFVINWYRVYHEKNTPILVRAACGAELVGLLPLCKKEADLILGIGEYHVWISKVWNGNSFIEKALLEIWKEFPGANFQFRFLPGAAPLKWLARPQWKKRCVLLTYAQPLLALDKTYISQELRKKNRREKINRLKRLGDLQFVHVEDKETFSNIFDDIAAQYDFRKGAMYNKSRFFSSPLAKQFLLALFDAGLVHVTILKVNDAIIASNVGTIGKPWVHLCGMNTHSPPYSKYSPGILHFLMLCRFLAEEGFKTFDLTPGGDSYKNLLANKQAVAYELRIAGSTKYYLQSVVTMKVDEQLSNESSILNRLVRAGILPAFPRNDKQKAFRNLLVYLERLQNAKRKGPGPLFRELVPSTGKNKRYTIYKVNAHAVGNNRASVQKDNLHDLLNYKPTGRDLTKYEFLSDAMRKLENGSHVYTISDNHSLIFCIWAINQSNSMAPSIAYSAIPPQSDSIILYDSYCQYQLKDQIESFIEATVVRMLSECLISSIYFAADTRDRILNERVKKADFVQIVGKNEIPRKD